MSIHKNLLDSLSFLVRIVLFIIIPLTIFLLFVFIALQIVKTQVFLLFPEPPESEFVSIALIIGIIVFLDIMMNRTSHYASSFNDDNKGKIIIERIERRFFVLFVLFIWIVILYIVFWSCLLSTSEVILLGNREDILWFISVLISLFSMFFTMYFLVAFAELTFVLFIDEVFKDEKIEVPNGNVSKVTDENK